ncbi:MAG TPA: pyruvate kinase [Vicinamibacterales bacterium]|nr:pyruvate kinase [Vicinamibacterales bacterium]
METDLELGKVVSELTAIRSDMVDAENRYLPDWQAIPDEHRRSARNLLHYLALRKRDLRPLQDQLAALGLSSLGRAESQALANVQLVLDLVRQLGIAGVNDHHPIAGFGDGRALLEAHTRDLLGPTPDGRDVRIMVTMPGEAADDVNLVRDLLVSGMNCMRINTAHDDADAWDRMIANLEFAKRSTGKPCRILMDLGGPKLRTGAMAAGPRVVHWRPKRDIVGHVVQPARIWLTSRERPCAPKECANAILPVASDWLAVLSPGDMIKLFDARDSMRTMRVVASTDSGVWAESDQSAYVIPGTTLLITQDGRPLALGAGRSATVGDVPATHQDIVLSIGDTLVLTRDANAGRPMTIAPDGSTIEPATIGTTLPEIFDNVLPGEAIWLDDGKIGGQIRSVTGDKMEIAVTHARPGGSKLGADKGINLPDSNLRLPPLTQQDLDDLPFIASRADIVGYSFVRAATDVYALQSQLAQLGGSDLGIILKIETRKAFENLPALLLAAMRSPSAGVMIARGDLAVECGYERLAEVQEEILWMAEASHTPVVWATQVLESLAKDGVPSRAEITDAAMGERAECVMLNKGPYILEAVRALDNILRRMQTHQRKKSAMLRELHLAERFFRA